MPSVLLAQCHKLCHTGIAVTLQWHSRLMHLLTGSEIKVFALAIIIIIPKVTRF